MDTDRIEGISSSLVREYLSRKGLKMTLQVMDSEMPRTDSCVSNRQALMKELKIEKLMKKNKEMPDPLRAMLEVITKYLLDRTTSLQCSSRMEVERPSSASAKGRRDLYDIRPAQDTPMSDSPSPDVNTVSDTNSYSTKHATNSQATSSNKGNRVVSNDLVIEDNLESETLVGEGKAGLLSQDEQTEYVPTVAKMQSRPKSALKQHKGLSGPISSNLDDLSRRKFHRPRPLTTGSRNPNQKINLNSNEPDQNGTADKGSIRPSSLNSKDKITDREPLLVQPKNDLEKIDTLISRPVGRKTAIENVLDVHDDVRAPKMSASRRQNSQEKIEPHYSVDKSSISQRPPTRDLASQKCGMIPSHSAPTMRVGDVEIGDVDDLDSDLSDLQLATKLPASKPIQNLIDARPINLQTAMNLKTLIFGIATQSFNDEWRYQSFSFCDIPKLRYGIVQKKGGPCGVLAAVQACVLQELLYCQCKIPSNRFNDPTIEERSASLAVAIAKILWRAGEKKTAVVSLPSGRAHFQGVRGKYRSDDLTETLMLNHFKSYEDLHAFISQNISKFELDGGSGIILFLYSCILSRFIDLVKSDMDEPEGKLMGAHGYCTQEMVNLILTGRAVSNVFNDVMELDSGDGSDVTILKGPNGRCDIGLLSLFEHYKSCQVGTYYKTPKYPIWVVCSESHFSVLFSIKKELISDWKAERRFDLFYYDGLARQQEEIKLSIDTTIKYEPPSDGELIPPLEHCLRTKWKDASVDWNGTEPLL